MDSSGLFSDQLLEYAVVYLLNEGVFDSPKDMRVTAMKDFGVFIPERFFRNL